MNKVTKYFAKHFSPGSFVAESWNEDLPWPDPQLVNWPDRSYCFQIFSREDVIDGDKVYAGDVIRVGPIYYHPDSKIETLEEVKANRPKEHILIGNMECNKWDSVIWSRWNNWPQPYYSTKAVIL